MDKDKRSKSDEKDERRDRRREEPPMKKQKPDPENMLGTKTGGAYIPPARLRMMQQQMTDKSRYHQIIYIHLPTLFYILCHYIHYFAVNHFKG